MIIRENQAVYVEDLCVAGLGRTRLAKSVHDAGWSAFVAMLEYKAARYGRTFARIGRFEPTSQVCSACGVKDGPKPLQCPYLDMRGVRDRPRPGRERGQERARPGAQGEPKRLPRRRKTRATPAAAGETGSLRGAA